MIESETVGVVVGGTGSVYQSSIKASSIKMLLQQKEGSNSLSEGSNLLSEGSNLPSYSAALSICLGA
jgi:hypothetical protein